MNELGGYEFEELREGMSATYAKTITEADIVLFAAVSGDNNAIHTNEEFAATTIFKGRIAHGMLSANVIRQRSPTSCPVPARSTCPRTAVQAPVRAGDTCMRPSPSKSSSRRSVAPCSKLAARSAKGGD